MTHTESSINGSVILHGYKREGQDMKTVKYFIDSYTMDLLETAKTFEEIYREIGYFNEV